jgi:hypothetical protein
LRGSYVQSAPKDQLAAVTFGHEAKAYEE